MIGELSALACAALWAGGTIALRLQAERLHLVAQNALVLAVSSCLAVAVAAATGSLGAVAAIPPEVALRLVGSVLVGIATGDSLYLLSVNRIGVSRALPIGASYPLVTALLSPLVLGEAVGPRVVAGVALVVAGVYLVALPRARDAPRPPGAVAQGVALALLAALCWGSSAIIMRPALARVDLVAASALRLPFAMLVLVLLSQHHLRRLGKVAGWRRVAATVVLVGLLTGTANYLYLYSVDTAGAARAATSPAFATPLAALLLGEPLTARRLLGTALTMIGVWLVI